MMNPSRPINVNDEEKVVAYASFQSEEDKIPEEELVINEISSLLFPSPKTTTTTSFTNPSSSVDTSNAVGEDTRSTRRCKICLHPVFQAMSVVYALIGVTVLFGARLWNQPFFVSLGGMLVPFDSIAASGAIVTSDNDTATDSGGSSSSTSKEELSLVTLWGNGYYPNETTQLLLPLYGLEGTIPSDIGMLSLLTELDLVWNHLTGTIPSEIAKLTQLTLLSFAANRLTGTLPSEIGLLTQLIDLELFWNRLTGSLPTHVGELVHLDRFSLADNLLSGPIPTEIGQLVALEHLSLADNAFTGSIPSEIGKLGQQQQLTSLDLQQNELTGSIPSEIGNLVDLHIFFLNDNDLTGSIPNELESLDSLYSLSLFHNENLSGSVPSSICDTILFPPFIDCENIECDCCMDELMDSCSQML